MNEVVQFQVHVFLTWYPQKISELVHFGKSDERFQFVK